MFARLKMRLLIVKTSRSAVLLLLAVGFALPCFAHHMAVVVSRQNALTTISSMQLSKVFRSETKKWPNGQAIVLVLHRASADAVLRQWRPAECGDPPADLQECLLAALDIIE